MGLIELAVVGCNIRIECVDEKAEAFLNCVYRSFKRSIASAQVHYWIAREASTEKVYIARNGNRPEIAHDSGEFLYRFDKDLTVETQKLRADLYFLHAAVLEFNGSAIALVAPSGYGKSTTTWGLLHHGLEYLSDELAPVDLTNMRVHPFPRALCLKAKPPSDYPLPMSAISTGRTIHVPTYFLPCATITESLPLDTIFFLRFIGEGETPLLKGISKVDATVRLFTNALNPLAHPADGLDAAAEIVFKARCFELLTSDLRATCELAKTVFT